ncbi:ATP-binding protein [Streptomyces sp. NRRL S-1314]|uniref:ATP-binding protein n=1 Tax=Streptomyces sp. NRRL S-1314 TaxID=1463882 RepID=UPI001F29A75D|nr:ATP-binding protein [Streptomyces sp. NRRL S-1314]
MPATAADRLLHDHCRPGHPHLVDDRVSVCFEVCPPGSGGEISERDARRVGMARKLTAARLRYCGLEALVDDAKLIVSELVTNAIQHGSGAQARPVRRWVPPLSGTELVTVLDRLRGCAPAPTGVDRQRTPRPAHRHPLPQGGRVTRQPTGRPQWRLMHPLRQRGCMQMLRCQVCAGPARTPLGWIFLAGPNTVDPNNELVFTNQPPVCPEHVRTAAQLCPHLTAEPVVFLALSAPLYGVIGVGYGVRDGKVQVVERPAGPVPYGHPLMPTALASQMVRRLGVFRLFTLGELFTALEHAP